MPVQKYKEKFNKKKWPHRSTRREVQQEEEADAEAEAEAEADAEADERPVDPPRGYTPSFYFGEARAAGFVGAVAIFGA